MRFFIIKKKTFFEAAWGRRVVTSPGGQRPSFWSWAPLPQWRKYWKCPLTAVMTTGRESSCRRMKNPTGRRKWMISSSAPSAPSFGRCKKFSRVPSAPLTAVVRSSEGPLTAPLSAVVRSLADCDQHRFPSNIAHNLIMPSFFNQQKNHVFYDSAYTTSVVDNLTLTYTVPVPGVPVPGCYYFEHIEQ